MFYLSVVSISKKKLTREGLRKSAINLVLRVQLDEEYLGGFKKFYEDEPAVYQSLYTVRRKSFAKSAKIFDKKYTWIHWRKERSSPRTRRIYAKKKFHNLKFYEGFESVIYYLLYCTGKVIRQKREKFSKKCKNFVSTSGFALYALNRPNKKSFPDSKFRGEFETTDDESLPGLEKILYAKNLEVRLGTNFLRVESGRKKFFRAQNFMVNLSPSYINHYIVREKSYS